MPCSFIPARNYCVLQDLVSNKERFLFLVALFLFFADDVGAQINCDSNPEIISSDTTDNIICSSKNNARIILERGVKIEPTNKHGIHISNSENVSVIAKGNTLINTSGDNKHGFYGDETKGLTLKLNDINLNGQNVFGIWVEYDTSQPGSLITIEVDNITFSESAQTTQNTYAGIKVKAPGMVDITSTGKIFTTAIDVDGVWVENSGDANGGNINISVNDIETKANLAEGIRVSSVGYVQSLEKEIDIYSQGYH